MVNIKLNSPSKFEHSGGKRPIIFTPDAEKSVRELFSEHRSAVVDVLARLDRLFLRLNSTGRLRSPDEFRKEHETAQMTFYAVRALPLRAYGWFCSDGFVVSHFIWKDQKKLDKADKDRMERNFGSYVSPPKDDMAHLRVIK